MFNESFNDLKWLNINAGIGLDECFIPVSIAGKFYDIYNELLTKIKKENLDMWLTIKKRDVWEFEITFDDMSQIRFTTKREAARAENAGETEILNLKLFSKF